MWTPGHDTHMLVFIKPINKSGNIQLSRMSLNIVAFRFSSTGINPQHNSLPVSKRKVCKDKAWTESWPQPHWILSVCRLHPRSPHSTSIPDFFEFFAIKVTNPHVCILKYSAKPPHKSGSGYNAETLGMNSQWGYSNSIMIVMVTEG